MEKMLFFAYIEGFTQAKRIMVGEKLSRDKYRKTTFISWFHKNYPQLVRPTEEEVSKWLDEYLAS
jgi:hypothetical protein